MPKNIYTFWEGPMPAYIKLCMDTWKFPFVLLDYNNVNKYTDLPINAKLTRFNLPKIADCVRVHVLRDQGGYWLDADTIMITDKLPETNMIGYPETRGNTCGYLYAPEPNLPLFDEWATYQDAAIRNPTTTHHWSVMANMFSDPYAKAHPEITIAPVRKCWPETYMIGGDEPRHVKYGHFYFDRNYHLADIEPTDMLMLHNSWTPGWYKDMSQDEILTEDRTLSNILRELKESGKMTTHYCPS